MGMEETGKSLISLVTVQVVACEQFCTAVPVGLWCHTSSFLQNGYVSAWFAICTRAIVQLSDQWGLLLVLIMIKLGGGCVTQRTVG
jgi:hypothetical protein